MVNKRIFTLLVAVALLVGVSAFAQTTANLTGSVTSDNSPLPGATVTISSPAMQGTRTAVTSSNGDYSFAAVPPGIYTVTIELAGLQTVKKTVDVRLAQVARADADLKPSRVTESITVTATAPSVLETPQVSTSLTREQVEALPIGRTIAQRIQLAPGVNNAGPNNQTVINGAASYDNLYMVNGVVVNDSIRGQPENLFIEDAIQETTLLTGGVSAEYGRFTGGVVNTLTKSGGNEFTGSLRDGWTNPQWTKLTEFHDPITGVTQPSNPDVNNYQYEATLGGYAIRDRLWFFGAGRKFKNSSANVLVGTNIPYINLLDNKRYEAKLTGQITSKHSLVASYLHNVTDELNNRFGNVVDLRGLAARQLPNWLQAYHYSGVITNSLLVEAQYSRRYFAFLGGGGPKDLINGTLLRDTATARRMWSPTFCGECDPKVRNNKDYSAKANYFLATQSMGSHNFVGGYDDFHEIRNENNYQSGSNYRLWGDFIYAGQDVYFHANPANGYVHFTPLDNLSKTSDASTKSIYLNDKWDFNNRWSFNIGVRHDRNDAIDQSHNKVSDDSAFSPRLGLIFDLGGNGRNRFTANYAKYVSHIDNGVNDATAAGGQPGSIYYNYRGPEINAPSQCSATNTANCVPTAEVIKRIFDWFNSVGGPSGYKDIASAFIPGLTAKLAGSLISPSATEYTFGYGHQFGANAYLRADLIHRSFGDFYKTVLNTTTGTALAGTTKVDVGIITNGDQGLSRTYNGVQVQGASRLGRFNVGGNYTWSKLRGNVEGETFNNATVTAGNDVYPEYVKFANNIPVGFLNADIRHRANAYANIDVAMPYGSMNFGFLQRYHSGAPFSAIGAVRNVPSAAFYCNDTTNPACAGGIANPGNTYATPPPSANYYFNGGRGGFRVDTIHESNITAAYNFPTFGRLNIYVRGDVVNLFNNQGVEFASTNLGAVVESRVYTRQTGPRATLIAGTNRPNCRTDAPANSRTAPVANCANPFFGFNPFTETPVEYKVGMDPNGKYNYMLDPTFGKPTNKDAFQQPQTWRITFGLRF
jgi:outer membrane receptor protein involved in Fe transport